MPELVKIAEQKVAHGMNTQYMWPMHVSDGPAVPVTAHGNPTIAPSCLRALTSGDSQGLDRGGKRMVMAVAYVAAVAPSQSSIAVRDLFRTSVTLHVSDSQSYWWS